MARIPTRAPAAGPPDGIPPGSPPGPQDSSRPPYGARASEHSIPGAERYVGNCWQYPLHGIALAKALQVLECTPVSWTIHQTPLRPDVGVEQIPRSCVRRRHTACEHTQVYVEGAVSLHCTPAGDLQPYTNAHHREELAQRPPLEADQVAEERSNCRSRCTMMSTAKSASSSTTFVVRRRQSFLLFWKASPYRASQQGPLTGA